MTRSTSDTFSLLPISAPTKDDLEKKLESCKEYLRKNQDQHIQEIYQEVCKDLKSSHRYRAAVLAKNAEDAFERMEKGNFLQTSEPIPEERPKLCLGFSGFGNVYPKMGYNLFKSIDCYKKLIKDSQIWLTKFGVDFDIIDALYGENSTNEESVSFIVVAVLLTSGALAEVWKKWGLQPDMVLGHSIGEYVAARTTKIFSLEDSMRLIGATIQHEDNLSGNGMIATICDETTVFALVKEFEELMKTPAGHTDWLEITARNSPAQTVVGGTKTSLEWFTEQCKKRSITNIPIPGGKAFHCQGIEPFIPAFRKALEFISFKKPELTYISAVTGKVEENPGLEYFAQHLRRPVNFVDAVDTAVNKEKAEVFLEVGPGKMITSLVQACVNNGTNGSKQLVCLPSFLQGKDELETMLNSMAQLYLMGFDFNWDNFYASFTHHKQESNSNRIIPTCINNGESQSTIFQDDNEFRHLLSSAGTKEKTKKIITSYIHEKLKVLIEMEEVPPNADLRDLGMDSTKAIQLKNIVHAAFEGKVNLGFNALLQIHTLSQLGEHITTIFHEGNDESEKREKEELKKLLLEDSILWPHIKATEGDKGPVPLKEMGVFLLTGATGQLAPYLLEELTQRKETKKVYCLVRPSQGITAMERLVKQLKKIDMLDRVDMTKVEAISGDVIPEKLGMDTDIWNRLSEEVDAVINCAVHSNHLAPYVKEDEKYAGVRAVNVIGTQRILEFACAGNKIKWLYQGSTILSYYEDPTTAPTDGFVEYWPPSLDDPEFVRQLDLLPNFGYGLSKLVADRLVYEATLRGIPCKSFRFGKIAGDAKTGKMDVLSDHFFCKFLHYLISGTMPDFDIPLIEMTVDACAKVSLKIFFHEGAKPSDIYNMRPPYNSSELEIAELSEEFGVPLRLFALGEKLLQENKDEELKNIVSNLLKIAGVSETPSSSSGDVMDDIPQLFENEKVMSVLKPIYGYPMRILTWSEYKKGLQLNGENSFIANWLEFYTSPDSIYQLIADKKISIFDRFQDLLRQKKVWWTTGKVLSLLPDLDKMVEHPMDTVRREIIYVLHNAREVFGSNRHFRVPKRGAS